MGITHKHVILVSYHAGLSSTMVSTVTDALYPDLALGSLQDMQRQDRDGALTIRIDESSQQYRSKATLPTVASEYPALRIELVYATVLTLESVASAAHGRSDGSRFSCGEHNSNPNGQVCIVSCA